MSGPGRPTSYKLEQASRARELCAQGGGDTGMFRPTPGPACSGCANRRPEDWQAKAETTPEVADDMVALLDAAGESMHHAGD